MNNRATAVHMTTQMVANFRSICREDMQLLAAKTRVWGFGCGEQLIYGNEVEKIVPMTIVKKYKHVALMSDGHCQRWEDLALLNINRIKEMSSGVQ